MKAEQAFQQAVAVSKKYTEETIQGVGAIKGDDGFSPIVSSEPTTGGTKVSIQDATHTEVFVVKDGPEYNFSVEGGKLYYEEKEESGG